VLFGGSKRKNIADARAVVCFLATKRTGCTETKLAERIGITRSAVVHAAERGEKIFNSYPVLHNNWK